VSDTVEKTIHINLTAKNLVKEELDKATGALTGYTINLQRLPYYFMSAGHALDTLNRQFFTYQETVVKTDAMGKMHIETITRQNEAIRNLSGAFILMGEALRIVQLIQTFISVLKVLELQHYATAAAAEVQGIATAISWAMESPLAVPVILAAAAAMAVGAAAIYAHSRQFGGYMPEGGLVMTHPGEWIIPRGGGGGGGSVYVDARGSTFSSDYDADRLGERMLFAMKRAGVTGP
jgi:hypothetical protein